VVFSRLFYLWRLVWTLAAFAILSVGGLILAWTVIPLVTMFMGDEHTRNRRARFIIREAFRAYVVMLRVLGILKLEIVGAEGLRDCRGKLIVANHPTLLDIVLLIALLPDATCIVKSELFKNCLLGPVVRANGYISNDSEPEVLIDKCAAALKAGDNLVIFPEGTRSIPGRPPHFQRGFAHIATMTGASLQPILITCKPITLVKGERYFRIPDTRPSFRIEVGNQIDPRRFLAPQGQSRARSARSLVSYLEADYCSRLESCLTLKTN
jgi:1-acyl-sn-glycerol-3-phosphate acyltransferase